MSQNNKMDINLDLHLIFKEPEYDLIKSLIDFPNIVEQTYNNLEPQMIANYLQSLSVVFLAKIPPCFRQTSDFAKGPPFAKVSFLEGQNTLLFQIFNKGGGVRGFWPKIPDFGQKSGDLPLVTAKIPDFFRACGAFKPQIPLKTAIFGPKYLIFRHLRFLNKGGGSTWFSPDLVIEIT